MVKAPMKTRLVYLACGLVIVVAAVAIGGAIGQMGSVSEEPVEIGAVVLSEDDYIRLTYTGAEPASGLDGVALVSFWVDNLSYQELTVYPANSYVNDASVLLTSGFPATVAPGKSYSYPWSLAYSALGIGSYDDLETLETKFQLWASDGSVLEEIGPFTVEFTQEAE